MEALCLMHPVSKGLVNNTTVTIKGARGKYFMAEAKHKAEQYGQGWVSYWWLNPTTQQIVPKCTFFRTASMDGTRVIVAAGIYGVDEAGCSGD